MPTATVNRAEPHRAPLLRGSTPEPGDPAVHGFTTREGGCSEGALGSLNLALRADEAPERLVENWRRVLRALGDGLTVESLALLDQVHGADVVRVERGGGPLAPVARADAAFTTTPGVVLTVRVADCVPVVVAGPGVVGVAHAGWRGTAGGVVGALVAEMAPLAGGADRLWADVGPHISGAAYEVGPEVVEGLRAAGLSDEVFLRPGRRDRPHVDLGAAVEHQLRRAGVGRVGRVGLCTATDPRAFSHRRDGPGTGRSAGVVVLRCG